MKNKKNARQIALANLPELCGVCVSIATITAIWYHFSIGKLGFVMALNVTILFPLAPTPLLMLIDLMGKRAKNLRGRFLLGFLTPHYFAAKAAISLFYLSFLALVIFFIKEIISNEPAIGFNLLACLTLCALAFIGRDYKRVLKFVGLEVDTFTV